MVFFTDRKLLAYGFLSDLAPWRFLPTGNCWRRVSCPAWLHAVACPQETIRREISRLRFAPLEMTKGRGSMVFLTHSKLFAYSFLSALAPWCFLPTVNCSPIVSCPTWLHSVSCPQETVHEGFPIRLGSMAFLAHRKLFAKGFLSDLTPWCCLPTGNYSPGDFSTPLCSARNDKRTWLHGTPYPQETFHSPSYPCKLSSCRGGSISLYLD